MRRSTLVGLAFAALPFVLVACDDKPPPKPPSAPAAPAAAASTAAPVATKSGPEYAESDFLENDRNRDPFRSYLEIFGGDTETKIAKTSDRRVVLNQFALDELHLGGIVRGGEYSRAMVLPPTGKGAVIKAGDFLGKAEVVHTGGANGNDYLLNWRVDRVRDGDVVLVREDPAHVSLPKATRVIPLHPDSERAQQEADDQALLNPQD
jgi:type IV pilus assembly protein PilP